MYTSNDFITKILSFGKNNFTTNTYEMKREILNFSKKVSEGVNKATKKFVMDMQYGLAKGGSCLISNIARSLDEENAVVLFDDSDINKEYSKKLEDLDRVIDASSQDKKIVNGYHVCEATVLSKNQKQPMSIYSKIYSCKSKNFISKNTYTLESIKAAENLIGKKFIGVFD